MLPKGRDTQHSGRPVYNIRRPRPQVIYVQEAPPEPEPDEDTPPEESEE